MDQKEMPNNLFFDYIEDTISPKRFNSMLILFGLTAVIFIIYVLRGRRSSKLPPGPKGLPIFGYYFSFRKKPIETLTKLAKEYGNVVGFYIGPQYLVFLNDWEAVKDGYGQNPTLHRPNNLFQKVPYKFGFGGVNGEEWVETRRMASKSLNQNQWEDLIEKELSEISKSITKKNGNPIEVTSFLSNSFSNNVVSLAIGDKLEYGHPLIETVSASVDFIMENFQVAQMGNFSETLAKILSILRLEKIPPFREQLLGFIQFVSDIVDSNKRNSEEDDSFISRFRKGINNPKYKYVTEDNLKGSVTTLITGGSETIRTSTIWALIAMSDHQDLQKKVHDELDKVIGKEGRIRWSERFNVPYTLATLLEALRWKTTVPITALREVTEDIQIQGYHIPKETQLAINSWAIHNDPRYWKNPDQFVPERFLSEDGQKVNMSPDSFNAFSYGKRNCPGKLLALMSMFQFVGTLMQKFKVVPKEGDKVKYEALFGLSYQAKNVELRFISR